jgi:FAD/FMN-containing dehydrogenase
MVSTSVIHRLKHSQLQGRVIDRGHSEFYKLRRVWNGLIDRHPTVVVQPCNPEDVTKVVQVAAHQGSLLAVRGGGHSLPGLSTCDGGIVLDLSLMRDITIDPLTRVAEVGGGAVLGDVDLAGSHYGLVTPAGVVSHTGVGNLTLGGGMGWLSRRFGLTIDNLLSADVVTADGTLRTASPDDDNELFWAIRGGGGNFGVVTKFRFRMHRLGPVTAGRWAYPNAEAPNVLNRYWEFIAEAPRELTTSFILTTDNLRITALWSGDPKAADTVLEGFGELGTILESSVGKLSFLELQKSSDENARWGRRCYAKGGFLQSLQGPVIETIADVISYAPVPGSEVYVLQLGGAVGDVDEENTAYVGRAAGHYWLVESFWDDPADDERSIAWSRKAAARLAGLSMKGNYVNEQSDTGVALSAYGEEKYKRLAKLKTRYDGSNLFRLNQNIVPV